MKAWLYFNPENKNLLIELGSGLEDSLIATTLEITLGFLSDGKNQYKLKLGNLSDPEIFRTIRSIVDLFLDEGIEYTADEATKQLINEAQADLNKRQEEKDLAQKLLKKKISAKAVFKSTKFQRTLKPYQKDPVSLIVELSYAANFSVPGSGKTTMLYAAYSLLREAGDIGKLFIIAPTAAYIAWTEEYLKCFGEKPRIVRITGPKYKRIKIYNNSGKHEIFITTYQTAASDVNELCDLLKESKFLLVLDESHNIKRFGEGTWASAVRKLAEYAQRRVILTGTPVPNSLLDLWSQFYFLNPSIVGTQPHFKSIVNGNDAEDFLRKMLMPYYRRVKKKDLHLPDPIFKSVLVKSNGLQREIYEAIKQATLEELKYAKPDRMFLKDLRRAILIRLMQAASNPSLLFEKSDEFQISEIQKDKLSEFIKPSVVEGIKRYSKFEMPAKIIAAEKLARSLLKNKHKKLLIWSVWVRNLNIMAKRLKEFNPVIIYGDIPINEEKDAVDNREIRIKRFKTDPDCRILIANPGACGESISLHDVCHDAIYLDRTFNAGQYMQSLDRIHRVGLDPSVKTNYYLLQVENTIDETINRRLDEKRARMAKVLNEDFNILNLETRLEDVTDTEDEQKDFETTLKDLKK